LFISALAGTIRLAVQNSQLKGLVEKRVLKSIAKIDHCQNSFRFCMLVCLGALNKVPSFFSLLGFVLFSSFCYQVYAKTLAFFLVASCFHSKTKEMFSFAEQCHQ